MRGYSMLPSGRLLAIALVASAVLAASFSSASGLARIGARRKRREPGAIIGFITDIEGDMAYLERYIALPSRVLRWGAAAGDAARCGQTRRLELVDAARCYFVFGGDLFDKGPWDRRLAALLVDLKRRHPRRVFLLAGNRDINKLRLRAELSDADMRRDPAEIELVPGVGDVSVADYLRETRAENTRANRLRYLYAHTLGCPDTFEFARRELAALAPPGAPRVTDEDVVAATLASLAPPDGYVYRYLRAAQLGVVLGDTLFVHGAPTPASLGFTPSLAVGYRKATSASAVPGARAPMGARGAVEAWVAGLNAFARDALDEFARAPEWDRARARRGGEALMAWQSSPASCGQTPVVASYLQRGEMKPVPIEVTRALRASGIARVCVGHKPCGDCPLVLYSEGDAAAAAVEFVHADLSRADASAGDQRGCAVAEVVVEGAFAEGGGRSSTVVRGRLADGRSVDYAVPADALIGRMTTDGYLVKARVAAGARDADDALYLLTRTRDRDEERRYAARRDFAVEPR